MRALQTGNSLFAGASNIGDKHLRTCTASASYGGTRTASTERPTMSRSPHMTAGGVAATTDPPIAPPSRERTSQHVQRSRWAENLASQRNRARIPVRDSLRPLLDEGLELGEPCGVLVVVEVVTAELGEVLLDLGFALVRECFDVGVEVFFKVDKLNRRIAVT